MAKALQQLLDAREPLFTSGMRQLESAAGQNGVDVELIVDITNQAHHVMRVLKLDTADTTAKELYLTLNSYIKHYSDGELLLDTDYVLISIDNEVVSMNLIDVIDNYHHELSFENRQLKHARCSLRGEIVQRYIDHSRTHEAAVTHIAELAEIIAKTEINMCQKNTSQQVNKKETDK